MGRELRRFPQVSYPHTSKKNPEWHIDVEGVKGKEHVFIESVEFEDKGEKIRMPWLVSDKGSIYRWKIDGGEDDED